MKPASLYRADILILLTLLLMSVYAAAQAMPSQTTLAPFSPLDLSPALWLDANDAGTLTLDGNAVISWADKSGNGFDAAAPEVGKRPLYTPALPAISFDGADDILESADIGYGANNDITLFVIAQADSLTQPGANNAGWVVTKSPFTGNAPYGINFSNQYRTVVNSQQHYLGGYDLDRHMMGMRFDGTLQTAYIDGEQDEGFTTATPISNSDKVGIGNAAGNHTYRPFQGSVSEVLIFQTALSDCEVDLIEGYLARKWNLTANLPSDHPLKTVDMTICTDQGLTIAENSSNGTAVGILSHVALDNSGSITWQLIADSYLPGTFALDSSSGAIMVADSSQLDFETVPVHHLTVTVSNGSETTTPVAVAIQVTDENDGESKEHSILWGANGELWNPRGRLPDFSYAGYQRGEQAIPTVAMATNVTDFGAVPDDGLDDTQAIQDAIDATVSGAVFLPAGQYDISAPLTITKSDIVLRGASPDENGGTIIYSALNATDVNGGVWDYGFATGSTGFFIHAFGGFPHSAVNVVATAKRGDRTLTVSDASGFSVGDAVALRLTDDALYGSFYHHLHADKLAGPPSESCDWAGADDDWVHTVERISGNLVTLAEPLRFDVDLAWAPQLLETSHISEVGIEDLRIEFISVSAPTHLTELGYNAIEFEQVRNGWIRNVAIENADNGITLSRRTTWVTAEDIVYEGRRGHHGISIFHADNNLFQNITYNSDEAWIHSASVSHTASGNVYSKLVTNGGHELSLDHHRDSPFENLFTEIGANWSFRSGGSVCAGPNAAARNVYWNLAGSFAERPSWENTQSTFVTQLGISEAYSETGMFYEQLTPVTPSNLYAAQLSRRLNLPVDPTFSSDVLMGNRANWFERDRARWRVEDMGGEMVYALFFGEYGSVGNGRLGEYSIIDSSLTGDLTFTTHVQSRESLLTNSSADFALLIDYQDDENYRFGLISSAAGESGLYEVMNGVVSALETAVSAILIDNNPHTATLMRSGNDLTLKFDDAVIATTTLSSLNQPHLAIVSTTQVGLGSLDDSADFDNIAICAPPTAATLTDIDVGSSSNTIHWDDEYTVYHLWWSSTNPYFTPSGDCATASNCAVITAPASSYVHSVTDNTANYTYILIAQDSCGTTAPTSKRQAKFNFGIIPGN
ncbi:MAG: glycosyl hydrolase family 28-related protein [Chloroflexota bacterium]